MPRPAAPARAGQDDGEQPCRDIGADGQHRRQRVRPVPSSTKDVVHRVRQHGAGLDDEVAESAGRQTTGPVDEQAVIVLTLLSVSRAWR
jgi:hypothetical protein